MKVRYRILKNGNKEYKVQIKRFLFWEDMVSFDIDLWDWYTPRFSSYKKAKNCLERSFNKEHWELVEYIENLKK